MLVFVFKTVPGARVMAGGDDDSPPGFLRQYAVADNGRRRGFRGKISFDAVAGNYLSGGGGEVLGGKPRIVPDDQPAPVQLCLLKIIRHALGAVADVFKGEFLGNDSPPAVRAELDGIWPIHSIPFIPFPSRGRGRYGRGATPLSCTPFFFWGIDVSLS